MGRRGAWPELGAGKRAGVLLCELSTQKKRQLKRKVQQEVRTQRPDNGLGAGHSTHWVPSALESWSPQGPWGMHLVLNSEPQGRGPRLDLSWGVAGEATSVIQTGLRCSQRGGQHSCPAPGTGQITSVGFQNAWWTWPVGTVTGVGREQAGLTEHSSRAFAE